MSIADIINEIAATASLPLNRAKALPRDAYIDETYFAHESTQVLKAGWLCVAHISQLKTRGTILPIDVLNEPIMLVRGDDDVIRALSRVCPHRSSDILLDGAATDCSIVRGTLTCPYHRWSFSLDGKLLGAPQMQRAAGFEKADWQLCTITSAIWQGFIFVNIDGNAQPLETRYKEFAATVAPWHRSDLELVISMDWECHFNWKVMVENWIESYHHLGPHTKTLNSFMPAQDTWCDPPSPAFIHAHLPLTGPSATPILEAIRAGGSADGFLPLPNLTIQQQSEWNLFLGFPCFMLLLARDRAIWYRLQPISSEHCRLTTTTLVSSANLHASYYRAILENETKMLRDFHLEDMGVNEAVQRGLRSTHAVRGRFSHLEEPVWQFHRQLAAHLVPVR